MRLINTNQHDISIDTWSTDKYGNEHLSTGVTRVPFINMNNIVFTLFTYPLLQGFGNPQGILITKRNMIENSQVCEHLIQRFGIGIGVENPSVIHQALQTA